MQNLTIEGERGTYFTPTINFDGTNGHCKIEGESYLEEPFGFYEELSGWFNNYFEEGNKQITLDIKLTYFNTSSSRAMLEMFNGLKNHQQAGNPVVVNWYYPDPDDEELLMEGEDFMEESGLEINMVEYEAEE